MLLVALAALSMFAAEPPDAGSAPSPKAPAKAATQADADRELSFGIVEGKDQPKSKRVCFNDPVSGSRIPTKRCMDRDEFYRRQAEARQYTDQIQRDARAPVSH